MDSKTHLKRLEALSAKRRTLATLSEEAALDAILSDPDSTALVHSFPEEDLFLLMHEIGPDDFLPVLRLATDRQWHFILDLETWKNDLPDYTEMQLWFLRFLHADPKRFVRFMAEKDGDLMDAWLFRNLEIRIREHDEDPSDFPDGFLTIDDVLYFRLRPLPEGTKASLVEARNEAMELFLKTMADISHPFFFRTLQEMSWAIPAELEEAALHWRESRMSERGFVPRGEALELFQPLGENELEKRGQKNLSPKKEEGDLHFAIPEQGIRMLEAEEDFLPALFNEGLDAEELQMELARLCNAFLAARGEILRSREEMDALGRMILGYLRIGLARITGKRTPDLEIAAAVFKRYRMDAIFRAGFGPIVRLKQRADRWKKEAWFIKNGLNLSFWDEEGMGILGGLFLKLPMRYDPQAESGSYYHPFAQDEEVVGASTALNLMMDLDALFALMRLQSIDAMGRLLTWKNFLLTLWASDFLEKESLSSLIPLHVERFLSFYTEFLEGKDKKDFLTTIRGHFITWLSGRVSLEAALLEQGAGKGISRLFEELYEAVEGLGAENIDHRYVRLFLLRPA